MLAYESVIGRALPVGLSNSTTGAIIARSGTESLSRNNLYTRAWKLWYRTSMNTNTTLHANNRVTQRLEDAGYSDAMIGKIGSALDYVAPRFNRDTALKVLDLDAMVGRAFTNSSNGDQVWAIIRNRRVVTVMLRRATQPATTKALKVDFVTTIQDI